MTREPDTEDLAVALYDGVSAIARRLRHTQAPGALSLPERAALGRLDRDGPSTAAELARAEQITPQAMGSTLSGLEERGFVARRPDPGDGRRMILMLTEDGTRVLRQKRDARGRQLAAALAEEFTPDELRTLREAAVLIERLSYRL